MATQETLENFAGRELIITCHAEWLRAVHDGIAELQEAVSFADAINRASTDRGTGGPTGDYAKRETERLERLATIARDNLSKLVFDSLATKP